MPSSLASCEFAWDRVVFPRCSLPSAHGQKQMDDLYNHELLWMLTRVISGYWDHNSFFFFPAHCFAFRCFAAPFNFFAGLGWGAVC